ncbi:hypothetical protein STXM2123_1520 [Streptomyces sp. F-3]|nr:hypothetical protein STXM2123_1520 [Streptomyces sp. F-3]
MAECRCEGEGGSEPGRCPCGGSKSVRGLRVRAGGDRAPWEGVRARP